jgi:hypothetical protein
MTHQPDLYNRTCGQTTTRQPTLFDLDGPRESDDTCAECGAHLVETTSGYWTCPRGHTKLIAPDDL